MRIAHLSDLHIGPLPRPPLLSLASKRLFGTLNWMKNRSGAMGTDILAAILDDVAGRRPDHIVVTGDLVNIALDAEFSRAAKVLASLGDPHDVSVVPGNHDAYVPGAAEKARKAWAPFLRGDNGHARFPFLRRREGVGMIGLSSAVATPPFVASGTVGARQREAAAPLFDKADDAFKVVLIHHPPDIGLSKGSRRLTDHVAVRALLSEGCADLVLHGHNHTASAASLATATGQATIVGVPSASSDGSHHPPAGYALYDIEPTERIATLTRRTIDPATGQVATTMQALLTPAGIEEGPVLRRKGVRRA